MSQESDEQFAKRVNELRAVFKEKMTEAVGGDLKALFSEDPGVAVDNFSVLYFAAMTMLANLATIKIGYQILKQGQTMDDAVETVGTLMANGLSEAMQKAISALESEAEKARKMKLLN